MQHANLYIVLADCDREHGRPGPDAAAARRLRRLRQPDALGALAPDQEERAEAQEAGGR